MEKARRRIRICLLVVLLAAVFIGILYYYYNVKESETMMDGTLICQMAADRLRSVGNSVKSLGRGAIGYVRCK